MIHFSTKENIETNEPGTLGHTGAFENRIHCFIDRTGKATKPINKS